jgi:hypothetical protein
VSVSDFLSHASDGDLQLEGLQQNSKKLVPICYCQRTDDDNDAEENYEKQSYKVKMNGSIKLDKSDRCAESCEKCCDDVYLKTENGIKAETALKSDSGDHHNQDNTGGDPSATFENVLSFPNSTDISTPAIVSTPIITSNPLVDSETPTNSGIYHVSTTFTNTSITLKNPNGKTSNTISTNDQHHQCKCKDNADNPSSIPKVISHSNTSIPILANTATDSGDATTTTTTACRHHPQHRHRHHRRHHHLSHADLSMIRSLLVVFVACVILYFPLAVVGVVDRYGFY